MATPASVSLPRSPLDVLRGEDYVSALHEWSQAHGLANPTAMFKQDGPPHIPRFTCTMSVATAKKQVGIGYGKSKQEAKGLAAKSLCNKARA